MFVTAQLQQQVEDMLRDMERRVAWLEAMTKQHHAVDEFTLQLAAERAIFSAVESTTDIAAAVIDALVMRDAGGYADMMKVLVEEGVLSKSWFEAFQPILDFRFRLLREHASLAAVDVFEVVRLSPYLFRLFMEALSRYLLLSD